jgi:hypothetical protein
MFRNLIFASLYVAAVHFAYVTYVNPTFEYAHYSYIPPELANLIATYALTWLVVLAHRDTAHPSQAAAGLIYTLCYVPSQLSLLFTINQPYVFILPAQLALAISMTFIFAAARAGPLPYRGEAFQFKEFDRGLGLITVGTIILIIIVNWNHMRFVSFEDVYDLRAESTAGPQNVSLGYLASWVSYCFISYFFARGIIHRKWLHLCIGMIGSIVLYMATGSKASLLLLPMTIGIVALWRSGPGFLFRTMFGLVILIFILTKLVPDEGTAIWAKSIILLRIIGSSGWVVSKYFEYYGSHDYTYYTHVGPINSIFGGYPYGQYSLGQIIGIEYSGSSEANFNASFWASDGFAAFGITGVLIITIPVAILMYIINRLTVVFQNRFTVAWNTGFFIAILNVPFSTALLSGGGVIILLLAWHAKRLNMHHKKLLLSIVK